MSNQLKCMKYSSILLFIIIYFSTVSCDINISKNQLPEPLFGEWVLGEGKISVNENRIKFKFDTISIYNYTFSPKDSIITLHFDEDNFGKHELMVKILNVSKCLDTVIVQHDFNKKTILSRKM